MADVPCLDHLWDSSYDLPDGVQTTLHVEPSLMSDRFALGGRSTCNKHMCDRNVHEPFLKCMQAHLVP